MIEPLSPSEEFTIASVAAAAAKAVLIPPAPPPAKVVAPAVAAARPAEAAPLNKLEAADCPVVIAL